MSSTKLIRMTIESFKLSKKISVREKAVNNSNRVVWIKGCHNGVACVFNGFQVAGSYETANPD
jgi:hypothetical protein